MAASEVATVVWLVVQVASTIQELGNNCYKANKAWKEFPSQVERLRRTNDFWQSQKSKFGLSSDPLLMGALNEAQSLLKIEKAKLTSRQRDKPGCLSILRTTALPAQIGQSIERATKAFEDILDNLKMQGETTAALQKLTLGRTVALGFGKDERYVRLEATEAAILAALDETGGPAVILLHGGPGKGKSTLVRNVALELEAAANVEEGAQGVPRGKPSNNKSPTLFEHVIFMECGPEVDVSEKLLALRETLGWDHAGMEEPHQGYSDSSVRTKKALSGLLKDSRLLIILDDVWCPDFLQTMVNLFGRGVKCLVTSQSNTLCRDLTCASTTIRMEDIKLEDARKILAAYAGFSDQRIPELLEVVADDIIHKTDANPLALTCASTAIQRERHTELREWESVCGQLSDILHSEDTPRIQGKRYPKSFWGTMDRSFQSLTLHQQNLLLLVQMCKGPSTPEEVIEFLYKYAKFERPLEAFSKSREQLEGRQLLKIVDHDLDYGKKQRSWSLHSLQEQFLGEEKKDQKEAVFRCLLEPQGAASVDVQSERELVHTLAGLYLGDELASKCLPKVAASFPKNKIVRRKAIEPITRLLVLDVNQRWTEPLRATTQQVFLDYSCHGSIQEDSVAKLLTSPVSAIAMLNVLRNVALAENNMTGEVFVNPILDLLDDRNRDDMGLDKATWAAFAAVSLTQGNCTLLMTRLQDVLGAVLRVLRSESHPSNQSAKRSALATLGNLAFHGNSMQRGSIISCSGVLEELLRVLSAPVQDHVLQSLSAKVLANLADTAAETTLAIAKFSGALEGLRKSLANDDNYPLVSHAARALCNLAGAHDEVDLLMVNLPGLIEGLVKSLAGVISEEGNCAGYHAAVALGKLARGDRKAKLTIVNVPGALANLVESLTKDSDPELQRLAAGALADIAAWDCKLSQMLIKSGAWDELVKLLGRRYDCNVQGQVVRAIRIIAETMMDTGSSKFEMLVQRSGELIENLVEVLSRGSSPLTEGHAIAALMFLNPRTGRETRLQSKAAYARRGYAEMRLGFYQESLRDLSEACQQKPGGADMLTLGSRLFVKTKLGDLEGALKDADDYIDVKRTPLGLQERGILKRIMGDFPGGLADLDESLQLNPDDYEALKHRGYVKFLMQDFEGARADAEMATRVKPQDFDEPEYDCPCLGTASVEYLDFHLK